MIRLLMVIAGYYNNVVINLLMSSYSFALQLTEEYNKVLTDKQSLFSLSPTSSVSGLPQTMPVCAVCLCTVQLCTMCLRTMCLQYGVQCPYIYVCDCM